MAKRELLDGNDGRDSTPCNSPRRVSTKEIKAFVSSHLPSDHPLRLLISSEKAELTVEEFRIKLDDWLTLFNYKS
jgi:hypothetical protein